MPISLRSCLLLALSVSTACAQTAAQPPNSAGDDVPLTLDKVVVTDNLDRAREEIAPSLGATQYSIDPIQISAQALGSNEGFNQVLLHIPGVAEDSFGQVHLRGEHANLQYRINDVLLPEGISGFGQELDTAFVRSANVITGTLPAQYGYRTAGVVDVHTQTGATLDYHGKASFMAGSNDTQHASYAGAAGVGALANFAVASAESTALGVENPTPARSALHDRSRSAKLFDDLSWVIDDSSRLSLMLSGSTARYQVPDNPGQAPAFSLQGGGPADSSRLDENQTEDNAYAILAYQKTNGVASIQASVFSRYSRVDFSPDLAGDLVFNGVASRVLRDSVGNGAEFDAKWAGFVNHTLRAGLLATSTNASTRTNTSVFPVDAQGAQSSDVPFPIADASRKLGRLAGLYAQDEWKPADSLTINAGFRLDESRAYVNEAQLSPRLNLVWSPAEGSSLHLGYARYFTPPPLELVQSADISRFTGTTNEPAIHQSSPVLSERAHYFDVGATHAFSHDFSVTVDAYLKQAANLLDEGQFGAALIYSPFNYRRGGARGLEFSANYASGPFSAYANLALSRAVGREIVSGEFQFDPAELDYVRTHDVHLDHDQSLTASAGASYRLGRTLLYSEVLYGSGLRRGFANTGALPAYHPVSIGLEHHFLLHGRPRLHARLDLVNLFDETYELRDGSGIGVGAPQYGQRRGLFGTVSYLF